MTMSKARALREEAERIEKAKAKSSPGARLMVINACCECRWSRDADCCWHPLLPGQSKEPEWCSQICKSLAEDRPPLDYRRYGNFPSSHPPPPWCPLPLAPENAK